MYLIVGLGNPGTEYENTRHNIGFRVIDSLSIKLNIDSLKRKKKCDANIAEASIGNTKVILAKPQTFMNHSGKAVASLLQWYKIDPLHIILIYDDVDLEEGQIRVREGGGAGGHHGVESVIGSVGTSNIFRVRIGVGRPGFGDVSNHVLSNLPKEKDFGEIFDVAADAAIAIVSNGISSAMNKFNT